MLFVYALFVKKKYMITHVAIWRNDTIYALPKPNRHHNVFLIMDEADHENFKQEFQGFLDDQGNFLDRREAFIYAKNIGQLRPVIYPNQYSGKQLFSEDLW